MTIRIAVSGNCQAQYLAAALQQALPEATVRAVGKPFDGPIAFHGNVAEFIRSDEIFSWLTTGPGPGLFFGQTTPLSSNALDSRLAGAKNPVKSIKFPYISFRSLIIKETDERFGPGLIKATIRGDEISNATALVKAGVDEARAKDLLDLLKVHPHAFTQNHFSGEFFAAIFSMIDLAPLVELVGSEKVAAFFALMKADAGISHINTGLPQADVARELGLKWTDKVIHDLQPFLNMSLAEFRRQDWSPNGKNEYLYYALWRTLFSQYKNGTHPHGLAKCLIMYRNKRRYVTWCRNIAATFIEQRKFYLAALVLANRMIWNDTRGLMLSWVLTQIPELKKSEAAKRVFRAAAAKAPGSTAKIVSDILDVVQ